MAGITLAQAEAQLAYYLAAEQKALESQRYAIGDRSQQRADLEDIQRGITLWDSRVKQLTNRATGRGRSRTIVSA